MQEHQRLRSFRNQAVGNFLPKNSRINPAFFDIGSCGIKQKALPITGFAKNLQFFVSFATLTNWPQAKSAIRARLPPQ
jgi:hypothetical protein